MNQKGCKVYLLVVVLLLILAVSSGADSNVITTTELCDVLLYDEFACSSFSLMDLCNEALFTAPSGTAYYYDEIDGICYEETTDTTDADQDIDLGTAADGIVTDTSGSDTSLTDLTATDSTGSSTDSSLLQLQNKVTNLEDTATDLQNQVNNLNYQQNELKSKIDLINSELQKANADLNKIETSLKQETNTISIGLAGLQNDVADAKKNLSSVETGLKKVQDFTKLQKSIFFIILIIVVALIVIFYLNRQGLLRQFDPKAADYITKQIKAGKKYQEIKDSLVKAGWNEEDVQQAYKQTMKKNYQAYLSKKTVQIKQANGREQRSTTEQPSALNGLSADKKKIIAIAIVSILLVVGSFLVLSGTVGKAIHYEKLVGGEVGGETGEVTYDVKCTPPHILSPDGDTCCLDQKTISKEGVVTEVPNGVCDNIDQILATVTEAEVSSGCSDNYQCQRGQLCINNNCAFLSNLHGDQKDCSCNFYTVKISTSDGESYNLKPNKGSYTAAGAIEWKILAAPKHCPSQAAVVPIKIIRKRLGEIVNEEVITLSEGQTSRKITHPDLKKVAFTLTVDNIFEPVGCKK